MRAMTCKELVELVSAYFDQALPADDRARFEQHVSVCPGCAIYVEQMRQTIALVGDLREEDVSPAAQQRLLQAFQDWKRDASG